MDKLDLTSSRVLKGSMKFTPKIGGKKDKTKKTKKSSKSGNAESHKKIIKKNEMKKSMNETSTNNVNNKIDSVTNTESSKVIEKENISELDEIVNTKSITVNTISNKSPTKNNMPINETSIKTSMETSIKVTPHQNKDVPKDNNTKQTVSSISKNIDNDVIKNNVTEDIKDKEKNILTDLKNKKEINKSEIEYEDDTISEISDDFLKTSTLNTQDTIEDSATEMELPPKAKTNKDNEETLIEEAESSDNLHKELSSELAEETLIIEDSQRISETDEEEIKRISRASIEDETVEKIIDEIKNKRFNKSNNQYIKKLFSELMSNSNESIIKNKITKDNDDNSKSIYELLEQEEFNQSIDTEIYNKPINNENSDIQKIVKEKVAPKRKVGRPPKRPRGRKPGAKKQVEVIVISDAENSDDETLSLAQKRTLIKKELEKGLPVKVKQENEESPVKSSKRSSSSIDNQESIIRQAKRAKTTKKVNNESAEVESQNSDEENEIEEENIRNSEKEKKAKKSKTNKAKMTKNQKTSKSTKTSKTTKKSKATIDTEVENEDPESNEISKKKKTNNKRKASSPMKKTTKKKKNIEESNQNSSSSSENEESDISISSRTIADIIDNYRGTEISTTQKEIYRLAALKRKATLDRKRGRLSTPKITTQTIPEKSKEEKTDEKLKVYDPEKNKTAIQMRVVNGEIVIDQQSTLIDHIDTTDEALPMLKYDENNHITSASFKPKLKPLKWSKEETELFYKCLSIFGTNFSMLAIMFPSRNRKQLLNKYKNEERTHPGHVQYALKHKMALDPEFFEKYSGHNMMEIGREAVEEVRLIEEQRKKEDLELFNIRKRENDDEIKRVIIKNEKLYDNNDVKDVKPILAN